MVLHLRTGPAEVDAIEIDGLATRLSTSEECFIDGIVWTWVIRTPKQGMAHTYRGSLQLPNRLRHVHNDGLAVWQLLDELLGLDTHHFLTQCKHLRLMFDLCLKCPRPRIITNAFKNKFTVTLLPFSSWAIWDLNWKLCQQNNKTNICRSYIVFGIIIEMKHTFWESTTTVLSLSFL